MRIGIRLAIVVLVIFVLGCAPMRFVKVEKWEEMEKITGQTYKETKGGPDLKMLEHSLTATYWGVYSAGKILDIPKLATGGPAPSMVVDAAITALALGGGLLVPKKRKICEVRFTPEGSKYIEVERARDGKFVFRFPYQPLAETPKAREAWERYINGNPSPSKSFESLHKRAGERGYISSLAAFQKPVLLGDEFEGCPWFVVIRYYEPVFYYQDSENFSVLSKGVGIAVGYGDKARNLREEDLCSVKSAEKRLISLAGKISR